MFDIAFVANDGPFGKAPEISVSVSDTVLLIVSSIGFVMLAATIYSIIITRLKTAQEIEGESEEIDYDDKLVNADVSTLTRAQRRARARHIMKQQRRAAPAGVPAHGEENGLDDAANEGEQTRDNQYRPLSRKDRQKAAKAAEKEERRRFEVDRKRQQIANQEAAKRNRKARDRIQAEQADEGRRIRQELKNAKELKFYDAWNTFLSSVDGTKTMLVGEWIESLERNRVSYVDDLANEFHIPSSKVVDRIKELLKSDRVTGFFENDDRFIYVTQQEMISLAHYAHGQSQISLTQFSEAVTRTLEPINIPHLRR